MCPSWAEIAQIDSKDRLQSRNCSETTILRCMSTSPTSSYPSWAEIAPIDSKDRFQSRNCFETNYSEMYVSKPYDLVSIMADIALIDSENVYYWPNLQIFRPKQAFLAKYIVLNTETMYI